MSITTDQPVLDLDEEDRLTQLAQPPRDDQPEHRRTRKQPLPTRIIWVTAVVTLATAGIAAAVGLNEDDTSTPANREAEAREVGEPTHGEIGPTEIDVHGIPTWWSGEPPAQHLTNPTDRTDRSRLVRDPRGIDRDSTCMASRRGGPANQPCPPATLDDRPVHRSDRLSADDWQLGSRPRQAHSTPPIKVTPDARWYGRTSRYVCKSPLERR